MTKHLTSRPLVLWREQVNGSVFIKTERQYLVNGKSVEEATWHAELAAAAAAAKKLLRAVYVNHYDPNA